MVTMKELLERAINIVEKSKNNDEQKTRSYALVTSLVDVFGRDREFVLVPLAKIKFHGESRYEQNCNECKKKILKRSPIAFRETASGECLLAWHQWCYRKAYDSDPQRELNFDMTPSEVEKGGTNKAGRK